MGFQNLLEIKGEFNIVKQHFFDDAKNNNSSRIYDAGKKTPFYFLCPNCKLISTNINNMDLLNSSEFKISEKSFKSFGIHKLTDYFKIIKCSECGNQYYIGIEYSEPNNCRTVYSVKIILEIENSVK